MDRSKIERTLEEVRARRTARALMFRRNQRLDEDGKWITVNGTPIHLNKEGVADKGPDSVKKAINDTPKSKKKKESTSGESKKVGYKLEKQGSIYIARNPSGYAITSGRDPEEVHSRAKELIEEKGPLLGVKEGESRTFKPGDISRAVYESVTKRAAPGSTITTKDGRVYTKGTDGTWIYKPKPDLKAHSSTWNREVHCSSDLLPSQSDISEIRYTHKGRLPI